MYEVKDIINFIKDYIGIEQVNPDLDLYNLLGNKFDEFIERYSKHFKVDLKPYRRHFHVLKEENKLLNPSFEGLFFHFYQKNERIPITPLLLTEFALKGEWGLNYPPYKISLSRIF